MSAKNYLLSESQAEELNSQIIELSSSELSLTEKLFRCRQILENLYKTITANANIAFTGLYARMQYVHELYPVSGALIEQLQLLRLLTNKVVHKDDFKFGEPDFSSSIMILAEATEVFSGTAIPDDLQSYLLKSKAKPLVAYRSSEEQNVEHIFGMVSSWKCNLTDKNNKDIEIICQTPEGFDISVTLWDRKDAKHHCKNWTLLDKALWKYCNISFYNLSIVRGMSNRYQSTPLTLVILEQDFLVDVSSIADCFQNKDCYPEIFILNKFFSEPVSPPLAKGKCVNHIFDELISEPAKSLKRTFNEYLESNPLQVFSLGSKAWQDIYEQIELDHYAQLRDIATGLNKLNCQLEPSFISLKFGLHGRLDVITLPDDEVPKYSIMELKSGSAPSYDVWKAHQMQVVGYNLILKEVFGKTNIANSAIFYSRERKTPLRNIVNHIDIEQDFLMCRNRIIGLMQKMATNPELLVNWFKNNIRNYPNSFITEKATHINTTLKNISAKELSWMTEKLRFIFREIWAVKTGAFVESEIGNYGFSSLWNCSLVEKKKQYRIIDNLWIESINEDRITLHRQDEGSLSNLRVGDVIVLYKQILTINEQQLNRGTIIYLDNEKIVIKTRTKIKQEGVFDKYTLWAIEPDLIESSLYTGLSSIYTFLCAEPGIRAKLLGDTPPEFDDKDLTEVVSWRKDVTESLKGMISARDYYLVQGPPGTGKTSCLLMQYVQHILSETGDKILLLSFTNRAVDEICSNLEKENISFVRLGNKTQVMNNPSAKITKSSAKKSINASHESNFESSRIFVSTLHSFLAAAPDILNNITINQMIIDEASQILEHQIIGLMSKIPKTILIGDQNQLPPIIMQQTEKDRQSVLEKLIINADKKIFPTCYSMLTNHYRMHDKIAGLVSDNYKNRLVADSKRQVTEHSWYKTKDDFLTNLLSSRIVWIDTKPSYQSKADACHAEWISEFIEKLSLTMSTDEICKKVGIISPFRAQAQCIMSALGKKYSDITVDTVERYQGSERDCIIMSYPIRYHYELSMLQSVNMLGTVDRKLNVALSRAREQLIILGSIKILTHSEFFHKVYSLVETHGLVIS